ncbi:hypothetical protein BDQ17DRAFT_13496 [Cyathus striatus]|nr:hypothetical protein BDQ17DRAFT_13496 [Cyathus striatus]
MLSRCITTLHSYLSAEQRLNYLVKINDEGKLLWAKNDQPVDTTAGHWKDAGNGKGIIPQNMPSTPNRPLIRSRNSSSGNPSEQDNAATHYVGGTKGKYRWTRYLRRHLTPKGIWSVC